MVHRAIVGVAALFVSLGLVVPVCPAYAGRDEGSWKSLENEPSRGELFQHYVKGLPQAERESFEFPAVFLFPQNALIDTDGKPRLDRIFGIDISHHHGRNFPFDQLKQQAVAFVYTKATQGETYKDPEFAHYWSALATEKILRGAYHFLSADPDESGRAQANAFVDYVNLHGGFAKGDLPPALDLEWDFPSGCGDNCKDRWTKTFDTPAGIISRARAFLRVVKNRTHRIPLIYTNKSFLRGAGFSNADMARLCDGYKVWIFDLNKSDRLLETPNPSRNLESTLWQFTWSGQIAGHKSLDVNVFKGSQAQFEAALLAD